MGDTICQNMNTLWVKLTHGVRMCYSGEVAIEKVYILQSLGHPLHKPQLGCTSSIQLIVKCTGTLDF